MDEIDSVVIGAGVVGLAVARALALAGQEVIVLEAEEAFGTQTSSRNSEVIHSGIYYPPGSLKARLCVRGRQLLYDYCAERGIAHRRCGKLVVAGGAGQEAQLQVIRERGRANGVDDLRWLTRAEARALEPALECSAALFSPSTGIVDSHGLMLALLGDLENAGGVLATHVRVTDVTVTRSPAGFDLRTEDGSALHAKRVVNSAGLHAPALARQIAGLAPGFIPPVPARLAKGSYFSLRGKAPFRHLVYPTVAPGSPSLGVHFTIDLGGQAKFGPDIEWVDGPVDWRVDPARAQSFYADVRRYWPGLPDGALEPAYAGVRPKIGAQGEPARDFVIQGPAVHGVPGLVNLFGIESPGLTSSLSLAEAVSGMLSGAA